jgi:hypothetical protein
MDDGKEEYYRRAAAAGAVHKAVEESFRRGFDAAFMAEAAPTIMALLAFFVEPGEWLPTDLSSLTSDERRCMLPYDMFVAAWLKCSEVELLEPIVKEHQLRMAKNSAYRTAIMVALDQYENGL